MNRIFSNKKAIAVMVLPGIAFLLFAIVIPVFYSVYLGMTDWQGVGAYHFVGLKNYRNVLFHDRVFWFSLRNAILLALFTIVLQHPLALLFAYMISKVGGKREKFFRAVFFVPCIISVVVVARLWLSILNPSYGLLNRILEALHLGFLTQNWLGNPAIAIFVLIFVMMWQGFGWATLIYYAGVKGLPSEVFEAARVDGAKGFHLLRFVTLPLLKPVIVVGVTLALINCLKQMEVVFLTTNGGPGSATQFVANYLYLQAFTASRYGYANAISFIFVVVCIVSTVALNKLLKKDSVENQ